MNIEKAKECIKREFNNALASSHTENEIIELIDTLQKENEELRKDLGIQTKFKEAYLSHWQNSKEENTKLKERVKELEEGMGSIIVILDITVGMHKQRFNFIAFAEALKIDIKQLLKG
jgi:uncharacterized coiled-coil DUF342 family protein